MNNITMPRITDKQLMTWYDLKKSELREFKENSGHGFMRKQIKTIEQTPTAKEFDLGDLKKYMKLVFLIKRNLELFLTEFDDLQTASALIIYPFIIYARAIIPKMPEEFHDYATWYTEQQLRLSVWVNREMLDSLVGSYLSENN